MNENWGTRFQRSLVWSLESAHVSRTSAILKTNSSTYQLGAQLSASIKSCRIYLRIDKFTQAIQPTGLVSSHFGYTTQIWRPESFYLISLFVGVYQLCQYTGFAVCSTRLLFSNFTPIFFLHKLLRSNFFQIKYPCFLYCFWLRDPSTLLPITPQNSFLVAAKLQLNSDIFCGTCRIRNWLSGESN